MSQWTHVLGMIRYDYMAQNCWCSNTGGKPECYNIIEKLKLLRKIYKTNVPSGSEGPLQVSVIRSDRGPIVLFSGDLRDFGEFQIPEILKWLKLTSKSVEDSNKELNDYLNSLSLRDSIISIDIEYYKKYKVLFTPKKKWEVKEINR